MFSCLFQKIVRVSFLLILFPALASANDWTEEASSGYFQEDSPRSLSLYMQNEEAGSQLQGIGPLGPIDKASFKADAHDTTEGYSPQRSCVDCHDDMARNIHTQRADITCRQCHRNVPVTGVNHYYSPLNPIRKHAYVCAKCHEGASANFSTYLVHEPNPWAQETAKSFPALYYSAWFMVILAGGVFLFFIPFIGAWGLRELAAKSGGGEK